MELLGCTKSKIIKNKNGEYIPKLEINEVILVHCNIAILIINKIQESWLHLFLINRLVNY